MKKAIIIYLSKKGTTKYFGHNIGKHFEGKGIKTVVKSMHDVDPNQISEYDIILLGCWTHGLFIALQHPEKEWVNFAKRLPEMKDKTVGLFTTYKLATGSMFRKMGQPIKQKVNEIHLILKSRSEDLNTGHQQELDKLLAQISN